MKYRPLGKTRQQVSVIGFGASPLGNVFGRLSSALDERLVAAAIDRGINLFDVSPYYGEGLAEKRLGAALGKRRKEIILATKCGRYGKADFDFSPAGITASIEQSLRRLGTDAVDLLQIHDVEFGDICQILTETIPALEGLKRQGKTRFIGITGYWPGLLARLLEKSPLDCVLNYCHWNLFADDMDVALTPTVISSGTGLINASPLHMGLLNDAPIPSWHPAPESLRQAAVKIRSASRTRGIDPGAFAVWKCLQHPVTASTLVGFSTQIQLFSCCDALTLQPDVDLLETINQIVAPVHNVTWPEGRVENHDIPTLDRSRKTV